MTFPLIPTTSSVSALDRSKIVGRPVIYVIIDVFSRLIIGVSVLLEGPSWYGAMLALDNVVEDKVAYCARHGITILSQIEWKGNALPERILADRGEFEGYSVESLINSFGIIVHNTAPYRADWKSIVERHFGIATEKFIKYSPGGVIKEKERGDQDYRLDAIYTLHDFEALVIAHILNYNEAHELKYYRKDKFQIADEVQRFPNDLWDWGMENRTGHLQDYEREIVRLNLLPRKEVSVTEHGIHYSHQLYYTCETAEREGWFASARIHGSWKVSIAYHPNSTKHIYLPTNDGMGVGICEMTSASQNYLTARTGVKVRQIQPLAYLRFCSDCVIEDRKKYGETYWHRLPQIAGINVCPDHECFYSDTGIKFGRESSAFFIPADSIIKENTPEYLNPNSKDHRILLKMANDARWLLSRNKPAIKTETIRFRYYNSLLKKGFAYYNGRIKNSRFLDAFNEYFSVRLLEDTGCDPDQDKWLIRILINSSTKVSFHPVRHLLIMTFLEMTAEELFLDFEEYKPFGDGPYPCLNTGADHFGKLLIENCRILDNIAKGEKNKGLPIGIFSCNCGFIYQRVGPDQSIGDHFRFSSVREYGVVWENKISEYWRNPEISITKIAGNLETSSCKIIRHAIRLGLPEMFPSARQIQIPERFRKYRQTFSEMLSEYRQEWLWLRKNNPKATRQELMDMDNFHYLWLRRNDSEWLEENLPPVAKGARTKEYLDWQKIDSELEPKVNKVISQIKQEKRPLKRVSITEIIGRVGDKKWLDKRESKLPLTAKLIEENLESLEDFMIRKVRHTKNLVFEGTNAADKIAI